MDKSGSGESTTSTCEPPTQRAALPRSQPAASAQTESWRVGPPHGPDQPGDLPVCAVCERKNLSPLPTKMRLVTRRCPTPRKAAHATEAEAKKHLGALWAKEGRAGAGSLSVYKCRCGAWHVGGRRKRVGRRGGQH